MTVRTVPADAPGTPGSVPGRAGGHTDRQFAAIGDVRLESSGLLPDVTLAYESWGSLNPAGDNAVLVLHALTGDSHVVGPAGPDFPTAGWWDGLIGPGAPLDDGELFVLAINVLGGCRGSTGPSSPAPDGTPYGSRFPALTTRDQVRAEAQLARLLGVRKFAAVIGGSMGGMRALEWGAMYPELVRAVVAVATTGAASADQIAWAAPQLAAIRLDPDFRGGDYYSARPPLAGMAVARQIAHTTYRSGHELAVRFGRSRQPGPGPHGRPQYAVESYLRHHGDKLGRRFDPNSYLVLTEAMNSHDLGRDRGGLPAALAHFRPELTVAVVDSDRLYLPDEGALLAQAPTAHPLIVMHSDYGHDGFLIEAEQVAAVVRGALRGQR